MKTLTLPELHAFLIQEAIAHTRTWLRAMRWSPATGDLLRLLTQAEALLWRRGFPSGLADEARKLSATLELEGFGIGGNTQSPQSLWPTEFEKNPWDYATNWPRLKRELVQIRWERWLLRRNSFEAIAHRVKWILWAVASFEDPSTIRWGHYGKNVAPGYRMRRTLAGTLVTPNIGWCETVSQKLAAGEKLSGAEINDRAIRQPTPVDWIHVENDERSTFGMVMLPGIAQAAYTAGLRGVFFTRPGRDRDQGKAWVYQATSDLRLRCWLPSEQWQVQIHAIAYTQA